MNKIFIIVTALFLSQYLRAQELTKIPTMGELLKAMPDSIMPMLTKNNRLDMIDFLDAKMKAEVVNLLDGDSEMTFISEDSLSIRMSSSLRQDLFLVDAQQDYDGCKKAICLLSTYRLETTNEEEQVPAYYSVAWKTLDNPELVSPFVPKSSILKQDEQLLK